jgi:hypothetical protein
MGTEFSASFFETAKNMLFKFWSFSKYLLSACYTDTVLTVTSGQMKIPVAVKLTL